MNDTIFPRGHEWTADDLAAVRAAVDAGELPTEVPLTGGGTVLLCFDEAATLTGTTGSGKNSTGPMHEMLMKLVRAGRADDPVLIEDPKDPAAPAMRATVGAPAAAARRSRPVGTITIHQLDDGGVCWREFDHHPRTDRQRNDLYDRIERGYRMAATMVTLDGEHQLGAHGTHTAAPANRTSPRWTPQRAAGDAAASGPAH
jgi:hypothetical protein